MKFQTQIVLNKTDTDALQARFKKHDCVYLNSYFLCPYLISKSNTSLLAGLQSARVCSLLVCARAHTGTVHGSNHDTNQPDHDRERLLSAYPWPQLPNQPSDGGSDLSGDALARRRVSWRAPCREFIRVIQSTENNSFELVHLPGGMSWQGSASWPGNYTR